MPGESSSPRRQPSTLAIAALSAVAALLGSGVGALATYSATTAQIRNQRYLERREDLRAACIAVQGRVLRIDSLVRSSYLLPGEGLSSFAQALREESGRLDLETATLAFDAKPLTTMQARKVRTSVLILLTSVESAQSRQVIAKIGGPGSDAESRAEEQLQKLNETKDAEVAAMVKSADSLAQTCRQDVAADE